MLSDMAPKRLKEHSQDDPWLNPGFSAIPMKTAESSLDSSPRQSGYVDTGEEAYGDLILSCNISRVVSQMYALGALYRRPP